MITTTTTAIIIGIMLILMGLLIYLWYRNNWVLKKRLEWINDAYKYIIDHIGEDIPKGNEFYEKTLKSYIRMWLHWSWNINSFVINKKLYKEVNDYIELLNEGD